MSIAMSVVFLGSLAQFCLHLARNWPSLGRIARMDQVYLAVLFSALMLQLWREKTKTAWMLMTTCTILFVTATHLVLSM
jgi:hypothetical protein